MLIDRIFGCSQSFVVILDCESLNEFRSINGDELAFGSKGLVRSL